MDMKKHDTVQRMMSNIARSVKRIELGAYCGSHRTRIWKLELFYRES